MSEPQSTITQDEYDALKVALAARNKENEALKELLRRNVQDVASMMLELNILKHYARPEAALKIQEARAALQPKDSNQ